MIIDLEKFMARERAYWTELEAVLDRLSDIRQRLTLPEVQRFHYLYQRASADLAELGTFAHDRELYEYLERLVARAYAEVHEVRDTPHRIAPLRWFLRTFPQTFRRHFAAFMLSVFVASLGIIFGAGALLADPDSKGILFPEQFGHLQTRPSERVAREERSHSGVSGAHTTFSAMLIRNNTKVSLTALALGFSYGVGTAIMLFYNGIILGAVCADYIVDGQGKFLAGWLLPHGSIEIPSILIAGQAGFLLAGALFGWGSRLRLRERLRSITPDLMTLIAGVAVLLVWAGIIEAFFSQYHEPVMPYAFKITFGLVELFVLFFYLARSGRREVMAQG